MSSKLHRNQNFSGMKAAFVVPPSTWPIQLRVEVGNLHHNRGAGFELQSSKALTYLQFIPAQVV